MLLTERCDCEIKNAKKMMISGYVNAIASISAILHLIHHIVSKQIYENSASSALHRINLLEF